MSLDEAIDTLRFKLNTLEMAGWGNAPEARALRVVIAKADLLLWERCHGKHIVT